MDNCDACGKEITDEDSKHIIKGRTLCGSCYSEFLDVKKSNNIKVDINDKEFYPKRHIQEYKRRCNQCGKVWHSLVSREKKIQKDVGCNACITASTALSGNLGAATQSKRSTEAQEELLTKLKKCPECGSTDYTEETLTYEKP